MLRCNNIQFFRMCTIYYPTTGGALVPGLDRLFLALSKSYTLKRYFVYIAIKYISSVYIPFSDSVFPLHNFPSPFLAVMDDFSVDLFTSNLHTFLHSVFIIFSS